MSAVNLAFPSGGADMGAIRGHETGQFVMPANELRDALWAHLDPRTVGRLLADDVTARQAPGIDENAAAADQERRRRAVDVIRDHLTTMQASYPVSFAHAQINNQVSVGAYLRNDVLASMEGQFTDPTWLPTIAAAVVNGALPALPAHPRAANLMIADAGKNFSVQFETAAGLINDVHVGGRPAGVFGSGGPGSHTTAFVTYVDVITTKSRHQTPAAARNSLIAFDDTLLNPDPARQAKLGPYGQAAFTDAVAEYTGAKALGGHIPIQFRAQSIARGVLMLLNTQPLSAVLIGGNADANHEAQMRAGSLAANQNGPNFGRAEREASVDFLWGLLDDKALFVVLGPLVGDGGMPGAVRGERPSARAAVVIGHHIAIVQAAYPHATRRSQFADERSLARLLAKATLRPTNDVVRAIAARLGLDPDDAEQHYDALAPRPTKKRKRTTRSGPQPKRIKVGQTGDPTIDDPEADFVV